MRNIASNDCKTEYLETSIYNHLEERVEHLATKYPNRPKKALLSLMYWCFRKMILPGTTLFSSDMKQRPWWQRGSQLDRTTPRILFYLKGGVGDLTISSVYLKEFHKFIGGTHKFSVCTDQSSAVSEGIFNRCPWVEQIYHRKDLPSFQGYEAIISFCTVPRLLSRVPPSKMTDSPRLEELLNVYETFRKKKQQLCSPNLFYAPLGGMYFLMNGHTRCSQSDIDHKLGMSDETKPCMVLDKDAFDLLDQVDLKNRTYITIQRGVDANNRSGKSTKLWPKDYYNNLIRMIHAEFPSLCIVQVGKAHPEYDLDGVDVDLRGQTSFEELKVVLKQSALHIDCECGMVHLNHTLGGRSAVAFGPTNINFFGYSENINVKAKDACPSWCEWVTLNWQDQCLRGFTTPPCMEKLTPELFFDAIQGHLHDIVTKKPVTLNETKDAAIPDGTILFLGDFNDDVMKEHVRPGNHVMQFSMNLTPESIQNKKARQIEADYADPLNIPMNKESCDTVFCSQTETISPYALREITRILKMGGRFHAPDGRFYVKENM